MSINLNDASFDAKAGAVIFNNGTAGVVNNVTLAIAKKKAEEKPGSPDYKLLFTDENGGSCNTSFWYVSQPTAYASVEEQIKKQGTVLKHVIHALYGPTHQLPSFNTAQEMLDGCMKMIRDGIAATGTKFRVFANYGSTQSIKSYIQPRSWVPFVESMSINIEDTRLKAGNIDAMERLEKDNVNAAATNTAAADSIIANDNW